MSGRELVLGSIIMVLGSTLQASVGFGIALFVVPLLALLNPALIPGPMLLASLFLAAIMAVRGRAAIDKGNLIQLFFGLFLGTVAGAVGLTVIAAENLPKVFGLVILVAVVTSIIGLNIPFTRRYLLGAGMVSGVMGTMSGIHGPPLALLYQRQDSAKVRATLAFIFAIAYAGALGALYVVGLFGTREMILGLSLAPGVVIGYLLSLLTRRVFDRGNWLRMAILVVATLSALKLLWRS
ncbi:MAG: TSUP family transporter [Deltaproteobacteria bacterium]|nr:TSUP family transporter [Deltaproteobacteria bacterium]